MYEINVKIDRETTTIIPYIKEDKRTFEFRDEEDVLLFLLKKIPIKPDIISSETAFQLVDKEIKGFSPKIVETIGESKKAEKFDFVSSLGVSIILDKLAKKLGDIDSAGFPRELLRKLKKNKALIEKTRRRFEDLKVKYEVIEEDLNLTMRERLEGMIEDEKFLSIRVKRLKALKMIRTDMVNLQQEVKSEIFRDTMDFLKQVRKTKKGEKIDVRK